MGTTTNPNDPDLTRGVDREPVPQAKKYLVLSEEERLRGFVEPLRVAYRHVGRPGPRFPIRDMTDEELEVNPEYVKYEEYPESERPRVGRFWTQEQLDSVGKGCGSVTTMKKDLAETYARDPYFYGATYCVTCSMHLPVGEDGEFVWVHPTTGKDLEQRVGTVASA